MKDYHIYLFFALLVISQLMISWFTRSKKLLNLIPIIYVVALLSVTISYGVLFNNIFMIIVVSILGYALFRRIGTVVAESRKIRVKKELEKIDVKDI